MMKSQPLIFQRKPNFDRYLPIGYSAIFNVATCFYYFKPTQIIESLAGFSHRILHSILDPGLG
jgi:hypothetical protein